MKSTAPWGAWYSIFGTSLMISCTCEGVPSKIDDLGFFPWWRHINSGKIEMIVWSSENKNSNICIQTELCVPSVTTTPTKTQLIQALLTCPHIPHMFNPIKIHQMYTPQSSDGTRKSEKKWNRIVRCFGSKFIFTIPVPIYKDAIHPSTRSQTADHTKCLHLRDSSYQLLGTNRGHLQVKLTMGSLDASYSQLLSAEFRLYKECQAGCSCVSRQYLFA